MFIFAASPFSSVSDTDVWCDGCVAASSDAGTLSVVAADETDVGGGLLVVGEDEDTA